LGINNDGSKPPKISVSVGPLAKVAMELLRLLTSWMTPVSVVLACSASAVIPILKSRLFPTV